MKPTTDAPLRLYPHGPTSTVSASKQGAMTVLDPVIAPLDSGSRTRQHGLSASPEIRTSAVELTARPPRANARMALEVNSNSTPIEIWEGTVIRIDREQDLMEVLLDAKIGQMPRHTAEIELQWVSDQDADLLCEGAVFYLTLFKRTKPSVENTQELRFRRRPSWSEHQLRQISSATDILVSKLKPLEQA